MKIKVEDSDGETRGGFLKLWILKPLTMRHWSHPRQTGETMWWMSSELWMLVILPKRVLSDEEIRSDDVDPDARAIRMQPGDALRWFQGTPFTPPSELVEAVATLNEGSPEAPVVSVKPKQPTAPRKIKKPGRPARSAAEAAKDKKIQAAWATGRYQDHAHLARELGIDRAQVVKVLDRQRKRDKRRISQPPGPLE